jgi:hypothetical protein
MKRVNGVKVLPFRPSRGRFEHPGFIPEPPRRRRTWRIGGALAVILLVTAAARGDDGSREYQLKAAFIYNFGQFIEWPDKAFASSDAAFVVAVIGQNPFGDTLQNALKGKKVGDHPIVVRQIESADEAKDCQLLFVPATEDDRLEAIFKTVADRPILTVGESADFPAAGGTIRFFIENNRIRFEVNLEAADKAGLKISSKLLSLARIYKK